MRKILLIFIALLTAMTTWASTFTVTNSGNEFTITRDGTGTESVYYRTVSLSGFPGKNYTEVFKSCTFTGNTTQKTVTITEIDPSTYLDPSHDSYNLLYIIQTTLGRSYRFEVLNNNGEILAYIDRDMKDSNSKYYRMPADCSNTSVEDLAYFDDNGNLLSGTGTKYVDVAVNDISGYSESSGWRKVTDDGYGQGYCKLSTDLFNGAYVSRIYAAQLGMKLYATVIFKQKEDDDGYQYIQILGNNKDTYDDIDPDGAVNDPSISLYKACFELSKSGVTTSPHYQFFPHRYDYVNKAAEQAAHITKYSFDHDNSYLYQQKFVSNAYRPTTSGSLILSPTDMYLYARFDAAGNYDDDWYFADLKLRLALADATQPTVSGDSVRVNGGHHTRENPIYVSVPFREIVTVGDDPNNMPKLYTTWGTLNYLAGSGSNVLTFSGTISNTATGTFTVNSYDGTITDLAGNTLLGGISKSFGTTLDARRFSISYDLDGGSANNPTSYTDLGGDITLNNPTRTNYEFLGWTGSNGSTPQLEVTIPSGSSGDKSYTANWKLIRYTYDSSNGMLTLLRGEFSKNDKWGSDVPVSQVTIVTATSDVSFVGDCSELFYNFTNCTSMNLNNVNTANVTNMYLMFNNCNKLTSLNISSWNTANVSNMRDMFNGCGSLTSLSISGWNTASVNDMGSMFFGCGHLTSLDLSGWNTLMVGDMNNMFNGCTNLTSVNLSGWNIGNVCPMISMFNGCTNLTSVNLSGWSINDNVSLPTMFYNCKKLTTIYATTSWNAENVQNSNNMFTSCTQLVGGCGTTYDSNFTDKTYARIDRGADQPGYFTGVFKLTLPANVAASPNPIFWQISDRYYAVGTTITLTYYGNVPEGYVPVYSVNGTAIEGNSFQMPLGDATVTIEFQEQRYTYNSTTGALTLLRGEFNKDNKWGSDVPADAVTSVDATSEVIFTGDCSRLFLNFTNCTSIDLDSVNTANVTNMSSMFSGCSGLTTLNVSSWNTAAVTSMNRLFNDCSSLTRLNLADWNTHNVTNMERMFNGCSSLVTIYASQDWPTESVFSAGNMFYGCTSLVGGMGTTYDANHVGKEYARIDGGPDNPGYFTDPNAVVLMPGDVNGDNVVDIDDVNAVINIILKVKTEDDFPGNADLNNDGTVDVDDMNAIINIILTH